MKDKLRELSKVERVRLFVNASDENLKIPTRVLNWLSDYADILDAEEGGYWPDGSDAPIRDYTPAQVPAGTDFPRYHMVVRGNLAYWGVEAEHSETGEWCKYEEVRKKYWIRALAEMTNGQLASVVPDGIDLAAIREGLELIAGTNGSECASPRAKAAELLELLRAIGDKP